ncbi:hypothetical protein FRC03_009602 [Tulasnella sp. 419]|nr:hypothetical protein FRC02_010707 [Tulasnella sp. 418]KAG8970329.1 hypothetical protein FRC03_009602 [Tulasnella sp. 419]
MTQIKLVLFDALYTIVAPRLSIAKQYSMAFQPFLGQIDENRVAATFPKALKLLQESRPAYQGGKESWWSEVVKATAIGAGADSEEVEKYLPEIMHTLMERFRTKEAYRLYDDVENTFKELELRNIRLGLVSNTDARMRDALYDLGIGKRLDPIVLSGEEAVEKPSAMIWQRACERSGTTAGSHVLHVGDELEADYLGAKMAGLSSVLLLRGDNHQSKHDYDNRISAVIGGERIGSLHELLDIVDRKR